MAGGVWREPCSLPFHTFVIHGTGLNPNRRIDPREGGGESLGHGERYVKGKLRASLTAVVWGNCLWDPSGTHQAFCSLSHMNEQVYCQMSEWAHLGYEILSRRLYPANHVPIKRLHLALFILMKPSLVKLNGLERCNWHSSAMHLPMFVGSDVKRQHLLVWYAMNPRESSHDVEFCLIQSSVKHTALAPVVIRYKLSHFYSYYFQENAAHLY